VRVRACVRLCVCASNCRPQCLPPRSLGGGLAGRWVGCVAEKWSRTSGQRGKGSGGHTAASSSASSAWKSVCSPEIQSAGFFPPGSKFLSSVGVLLSRATTTLQLSSSRHSCTSGTADKREKGRYDDARRKPQQQRGSNMKKQAPFLVSSWVAESPVGGLTLCALPSLAVVLVAASWKAWGGAIPVPIINFFCSHGCCTTMTFVLIPILPPGGRAEHTHTRGGLEHPPQSGLVEQFSKDGPPIHS